MGGSCPATNSLVWPCSDHFEKPTRDLRTPRLAKETLVRLPSSMITLSSIDDSAVILMSCWRRSENVRWQNNTVNAVNAIRVEHTITRPFAIFATDWNDEKLNWENEGSEKADCNKKDEEQKQRQLQRQIWQYSQPQHMHYNPNTKLHVNPTQHDMHYIPNTKSIPSFYGYIWMLCRVALRTQMVKQRINSEV